MVSWAIKDFGGMIPRTESRNLPPNNAEQATNCDLSSGVIKGLPVPRVLQNFSGMDPFPQRAYRLPGSNDGKDAWLPLPSPFASVCRSPLANDTLRRIYWTVPGLGAFWTFYGAMIAGGTGEWAPYNLGMIQPDPVTSTLSITTFGGTTDGSVPLVTRSYCWTYIDEYGQESAPNAPSAAITGPPDANWNISGIPSSPPPTPPDVHYPVIIGISLYRTSTGTQTGAQFYLAYFFEFGSAHRPPPPGFPYVDVIPDTVLVNNNPLASAAWANPPNNLDGLTALPGGMLVGFTGNTVHFCEPDQPHAWPAAYDQSLQYDIVGLAVWQQSLVVLTQGYPSTGAGNSPANFVFTQVRVPEPCISRGSIITDLMGVYYASQNGLVMLNYFGMQNQTLSMFTKNEWLRDFNAGNIIACRHRAQYLAMNNSGNGGFIIDYSESRLGVMPVSSLLAAACVWNDEYNGTTYVMAGGKVYEWDSPDTGPLTFRWRSKQFYGPAPVSLGACQITLDPEITTAVPNTDPLFNGDPTIKLPPRVRAIARIFAGPDGQNLLMTKNLRLPREIFRLPSGFKAFDWQIEVVSCVGVRSIELASTMKELRNV